MTSASSPKRQTRKSYAERVVGALSQVQRQHKKHVVHVATIRAQIRKMANTDEDRLGPHWTRWVSLTVNKLEDQGILQSKGSGNITFTPKAKRTINVLRRASSPGTIASYALDTDLLKTLTHGRVPSLVLHTNDELHPVPSRRVTSVRKGTGVSVSRMNKAELQNELRTLQRANRVSQQEGNAMISDLKQELRSLRLMLSEAETVKTPERHHQSSWQQLQTPHSSIIDDIQASDHEHSHRLPSLIGLIRTESGTLIDRFTRQATPAPSQPPLSPLTDLDDDPSFDTYAAPLAAVYTRDLSPPSHVEEDEYTANLSANIASLHRTLEARESTISAITSTVEERSTALQTVLEQLQAEKNRADTAEAALEHEHSLLSSVIAQNSALVQKVEDLESNSSRANDEACAKMASIVAQLTGTQFSLQETAKERDKAIDHVESLRAKICSLTATHRNEAQRLSTVIDELRSQAQISSSETLELNQQLQSLTELRSVLSSDLESRNRRVETKRLAQIEDRRVISGLRSDKDELIATVGTLQDTLAHTLDALHNRDQEVARLVAELKDSTAVSDALFDQIGSAKVDMARFQQEASELADAVEAARAEVAVLRGAEGAMLAQLDGVTRQLTAARAAHETALVSLETSLRETRGQVEVVTSTLRTTESVLSLSEGMAEELRSAVAVEQLRSSQLKEELSMANDLLEAQKEENEQWQQVKIRDETIFSDLKNSYSEMRKIHVNLLSRMDDEIASMHLSPVPCHGSEAMPACHASQGIQSCDQMIDSPTTIASSTGLLDI